MEKSTGPTAYDRILGSPDKYDGEVWSGWDDFAKTSSDIFDVLRSLIGDDSPEMPRAIVRDRKQLEQIIAMRCELPQGSHVIAVVRQDQDQVRFYEHLDVAMEANHYDVENSEYAMLESSEDRQLCKPSFVREEPRSMDEIMKPGPNAFDRGKSDSDAEHSFSGGDKHDGPRRTGHGHYPEEDF